MGWGFLRLFDGWKRIHFSLDRWWRTLSGGHIKFSENAFNTVLNFLARHVTTVDLFCRPSLPDRLICFSINNTYGDRTFSYWSLAIVISHELWRIINRYPAAWIRIVHISCCRLRIHRTVLFYNTSFNQNIIADKYIRFVFGFFPTCFCKLCKCSSRWKGR